MDLGLLYSNFVMDNKDLTLHTTVDGLGVFRDTDGQTHCTIRPYRDEQPGDLTYKTFFQHVDPASYLNISTDCC